MANTLTSLDTLEATAYTRPLYACTACLCSELYTLKRPLLHQVQTYEEEIRSIQGIGKDSQDRATEASGRHRSFLDVSLAQEVSRFVHDFMLMFPSASLTMVRLDACA